MQITLQPISAAHNVENQCHIKVLMKHFFFLFITSQFFFLKKSLHYISFMLKSYCSFHSCLSLSLSLFSDYLINISMVSSSDCVVFNPFSQDFLHLLHVGIVHDHEELLVPPIH